MSNHCANRLDIEAADQDTMQAVLNLLGPIPTGDRQAYWPDFGIILPEPDPRPEGWDQRQWRIDHWGTKGKGIPGMREGYSVLEREYHFGTPNNAPEAWFRELAERCAALDCKIELSSAEVGCLIGLQLSAERGEIEELQRIDGDRGALASLIDEKDLDTWLEDDEDDEDEEEEKTQNLVVGYLSSKIDDGNITRAIVVVMRNHPATPEQARTALSEEPHQWVQLVNVQLEGTIRPMQQMLWSSMVLKGAQLLPIPLPFDDDSELPELLKTLIEGSGTPPGSEEG